MNSVAGKAGPVRQHRARAGNSLRFYLFTLIQPFLALVTVLFRPRAPSARNVVWLFIIFYGAVFFIAPNSTSDSVRYADYLEQMHSPFFGFEDLISDFLDEDERTKDPYQPVITYLVSVVTGDHWLLFAAFGVLIGYVLTRNIWFLVDRTPAGYRIALPFLICAFAFHVDIGSSLNGVRMWTALHVFLFGFMHYYSTGRRSYLWPMLLTPLIHYSFYLMVVLLCLFQLARHFPRVVFIIFLISFGNVMIEVGVVRQVISMIPLGLEERASSYLQIGETIEEVGRDSRGSSIWFLRLNQFCLEVFSLLVCCFLMWKKAYRKSREIGAFLIFGMLSYALINMTSHIPSVGRFYNIPEMLFIAAAVLYIADSRMSSKADRQILGVGSGLLAINLALGIRFTLGFASVWLFAGNLFIGPFVDATWTAYDAIMYLLFGREPTF